MLLQYTSTLVIALVTAQTFRRYIKCMLSSSACNLALRRSSIAIDYKSSIRRVLRCLTLIRLSISQKEFLFDIIELKTAMIMYKANKKMLPLNIQRLFSVDEVTYYNTRQLKNMLHQTLKQNVYHKTLELVKNGP